MCTLPVQVYRLLKNCNISLLCHTPRLEGVEVRLQESSEAFEKSREGAKKSKIEYEKVKKQRCVIK